MLWALLVIDRYPKEVSMDKLKKRQPLDIRQVANAIINHEEDLDALVPNVTALAKEYVRLIDSNRLPDDPMVKFRVTVEQAEDMGDARSKDMWYVKLSVAPHGDDDNIFINGPYTEAQARQVGRSARERLGLNQKFRVNLPDGSVTDIEAEDLRSCLDEVCKLVGPDVLASSLSVKRL